MALNTKRFLVLDPIIWPTLPPKPGFHDMPPHQAKEGALLLLEAGAPAYPALVRMSERSVFGGFSMQDAIDLSDARAAEREKAKADAERRRRVARGELVVINPVSKAKDISEDDAQERKRIAGLKEFPVKAHHGIAVDVLIAMAGYEEPVKMSKEFRLCHRLYRPINQLTNTALRLVDMGVLTRLSVGKRGEPSTFEVTDLGRANAKALKGGSHAEKA